MLFFCLFVCLFFFFTPVCFSSYLSPPFWPVADCSRQLSRVQAMAPSFLRDVRETWVRNGRPGEQPPSPKSDFSVGNLIRRLFCGEGAAGKLIRAVVSLCSWQYCVGARLRFWRRSRVPNCQISLDYIATAPPPNLTRLLHNTASYAG